jgi:hypothetical protein
MKKLFFLALLPMLLFIGCKTTAVLSSKVSLGMTKTQVIQICGTPFKTAAQLDSLGNTQEILYYKEKIYEFKSDSFTTVNHMFCFTNEKLVAIKQGDEQVSGGSNTNIFLWKF